MELIQYDTLELKQHVKYWMWLQDRKIYWQKLIWMNFLVGSIVSECGVIFPKSGSIISKSGPIPCLGRRLFIKKAVNFVCKQFWRINNESEMYQIAKNHWRSRIAVKMPRLFHHRFLQTSWLLLNDTRICPTKTRIR